jgi:hypothetical protein
VSYTATEAMAGAAASLLAAVMAVTVARAATFVGPPSPPLVRYADGHVTVRADGAPLSGILERLADAASMRLRGEVVSDRLVTLRVTDVPLRQAVERLLVDQNFTLRYGADGQPRRLTLRGQPIVRPPSRGRTGRVAQSGRAPLLFRQRFGSHPPLRIGGILAGALGGAEARLPRIARATADRNPAIRRAAMRRMLTAIEVDPLLRTGFEAMTVHDLAAFARANALQYAPELTSFLAVHAGDGGVRRRARAALTSVR